MFEEFKISFVGCWNHRSDSVDPFCDTFVFVPEIMVQGWWLVEILTFDEFFQKFGHSRMLIVANGFGLFCFVLIVVFLLSACPLLTDFNSVVNKKIMLHLHLGTIGQLLAKLFLSDAIQVQWLFYVILFGFQFQHELSYG